MSAHTDNERSEAEVDVPRLVRLCVECAHHRINPRGGNVLCANPHLGLDADIPETGFVAGVPARYMRERWYADDDSEYILSQFKDGICGRAGNWFLPNAGSDAARSD